jgi:hypothetical protein
MADGDLLKRYRCLIEPIYPSILALHRDKLLPTLLDLHRYVFYPTTSTSSMTTTMNPFEVLARLVSMIAR